MHISVYGVSGFHLDQFMVILLHTHYV